MSSIALSTSDCSHTLRLTAAVVSVTVSFSNEHKTTGQLSEYGMICVYLRFLFNLGRWEALERSDLIIFRELYLLFLKCLCNLVTPGAAEVFTDQLDGDIRVRRAVWKFYLATRMHCIVSPCMSIQAEPKHSTPLVPSTLTDEAVCSVGLKPCTKAVPIPVCRRRASSTFTARWTRFTF